MIGILRGGPAIDVLRALVHPIARHAILTSTEQPRFIQIEAGLRVLGGCLDLIFERGLILQFLGGFAIELIPAMINLAVGVIPSITAITVDPVLAIDLGVISATKVHLVAVVALLVVLETIVAPLAELDLLARVQPRLEEAGADRGRRGLFLSGWQLNGPGGSFQPLGRQILLLGVVGAAELVIAVVFLRWGHPRSSALPLGSLHLLTRLF